MTEKERNCEERRREQRIDGEHLDRRPGHGAGSYNDEIIDRDAEVRGNDGPRTTFYEKDVDKNGVLRSDGSRVSFSQLWHKHMDYDSASTPVNEYDDMERHRRRKGMVHVFTSRLEATPVQRKKALAWTETDMSNAGSLSEESIVAAAVSLACNVDERWVQREDDFRELLVDLDIDYSKLTSAREYLKSEYEIE